MDLIDPTSPRPVASAQPVAPSPSGGRENPVFNLLDVGLTLLVAVGALFFCVLVAAIVLAAIHGPRSLDFKDPTRLILFLLPVQVVSYILTVGFMVFLIWVKYRTRFLEAVRWNMPGAKAAWWALAGGAGLGLFSEVASALLHRWTPKSLPIDQYLRTPSSAYALAAFGILVAPMVEELFFRGFLYPALARPLGVALATVLTAGGFALIHSQQLAHAWVPLLLIFTVGMVLTVVRARSQSVAVCVLIHTGYNFTLFTLLWVASQGFHHMERG